MVRKVLFLGILGALLLHCPLVSATDFGMVRQAGMDYAGPGEEVMVEGPFFVEGAPYWIVDFVKKGEIQTSLVYSGESQEFVTDKTIMKEVFGTRGFKDITMADPLFFAVGDPSVIPLGAKYETQNIRNFAAFSPLDADEREALETFLRDYEIMAQKIADSMELTNSLLRPGVDIRVSYEEYPLDIIIETKDTEARFSYEECQRLLDAYEAVYSQYAALLVDLDNFTGNTDEIPPGTIIRQKRGIKITKESLLGEIELANKNGEEIRKEIEARRAILTGDYSKEIKSAKKRLNKGIDLNLKIGVIAFLLVLVLILRFLRKPPGGPAILLVAMVLPALINTGTLHGIPTPGELLAQQVKDPTTVRIQLFGEGTDLDTVREIITGYPLILEGEEVYVRGPYYDEDQAYYLFDVVDDGVPTGNMIIVDNATLHMVGGYRLNTRLVKTSFITDMVEKRPLYQGVDTEILEKEALESGDSSMAVFLARLAENVKEGKELEKELLEKPNFDTARDLARHYKQGYIIIGKMEQLAPPEEVETLTNGFSKEADLLEAYSLVVKYTITDDWLKVAEARHRGRSLNRIPMMMELAAAGMKPGRLQVVHDLTTDLIYGNDFIWRLGKIEGPYFASLPRKVGEISKPGGG